MAEDPFTPVLPDALGRLRDLDESGVPPGPDSGEFTVVEATPPAAGPTLPPRAPGTPLPNRPLVEPASAPTGPAGPTQFRPTTYVPPRGARRRWPWLVAVLLAGGGGAFLVFGTDGEPETKVVTQLDSVAPQDLPGVGATQTTVGFDVTLLQVVDPWVPTEAIEAAAPGRRLVAVELAVRNGTGEPTTVLAQTMVQLRHDGGQVANFGMSLFDLAPFDGPVAPLETRQGWVVFEMPDTATDLVLEVRGALVAAPVSFAL